MDRITQTALAMYDYMKGDIKRINHFTKVHDYAAIIGKAEGLSGREQEILEVTAYTHDIGIKVSEEKYGSSSGYYQQLEGPGEAEKLLKPIGFEDAFIARVKELIARHHKYNNIDGPDCQILIEADFIVNCDEDHVKQDTINDVYSKIFKTEAGKKIMECLFNAEAV